MKIQPIKKKTWKGRKMRQNLWNIPLILKQVIDFVVNKFQVDLWGLNDANSL